METPVKQRLIGALVLALVAILFLPMLLKPDVKSPDVSEVPLDMPKAPESQFETRDLPLNVPASKTPEGGVLGVPKPPVETVVPTRIIDTPTTVDINTPADTAATIAPSTTPISKPVESVKPTEVKPAIAITKPTPVEVKPAAVAAGNFTITIGSFTKIDSANALVASLKAQKLPVLTDKITVDGKPALKIRIGPYVDRASAEAARLKADEIAGGASKVNVQDAAPVAALENKKPPTSTKPTASAMASGFSVQLQALSDNAKAEEMRDRARGLGFNAFVKRVETEKGVLYSVRLGPVADREAANKLRDEATQKLGITGFVKTHP